MMVDKKPSSTSKTNWILIIVPITLVICLCCCVMSTAIGLIVLNKGDGESSTLIPEFPEINPPAAQNLPTVDPQKQTWLVMLYLNADDAVLEEDIFFDLNEAEMIGSTDRVQIVAQMDRHDEGFTGDGDWTTARRYYVTQDSDLTTIHSEMLTDLGEVDMGSRDTLADFTTWAIQSYPADKYVLILSDHGSGWPGGWSDGAPQNPNGNWLHLSDVEYALSQTIASTGIGHFELIGLDACLMSMLEVYNSLAPYAHYAVASQEIEPAFGWAYASFLSALTRQPTMTGFDLGRAIVDSYIVEDQRIQNDVARKKFLTSFGLSEDVSAKELAEEMESTITIAAVDLSTLPAFNDALDAFLTTLKEVDQSQVAESRSYAQAYHNVFDETYPSPYIDLSNFGSFVAEASQDEAAARAFQQLEYAYAATVYAERHGSQRPGSRGISVYFPVSELYWDETLGSAYYAEAARQSASQTLWDDFLAYHYAGQDFGQGIPSREARLPAPGSSRVTIEPIELSKTTLAPKEKVNIQTDIRGENIANISLVALFKHEDRYLAYFLDYIKGDKSEQQNGVMYPVWERTNEKIHIDLDWVPAPDAVCNGTTCAFALLNPDKYTPDTKDLLYFVEGWYINAQTGKKLEGTLYFNNYGENQIHHIVVHTPGIQALTLPRVIIPVPGDQFMMLDTWWKVGQNGEIEDFYQEGNVISFSSEPLYTVSAGEADPGEYAIGIMVEDMDGFLTFQFAPINIK